MLGGGGLPWVDAMVFSHEDLDHSGGALTVLESIEVGALASSLPESHALNALVPGARRCVAGMAWVWDGVKFEFLHPDADTKAVRRNDSSCVLRIDTAGGAMLLTGGVERPGGGDVVKKWKTLRP